MSKYRKKSFEVYAVQFLGDVKPIKEWVKQFNPKIAEAIRVSENYLFVPIYPNPEGGFEGIISLKHGYYLIKISDNSFDPMTKEDFENEFELHE